MMLSQWLLLYKDFYGLGSALVNVVGFFLIVRCCKNKFLDGLACTANIGRGVDFLNALKRLSASVVDVNVDILLCFDATYSNTATANHMSRDISDIYIHTCIALDSHKTVRVNKLF